jgi:hypothetical protein
VSAFRYATWAWSDRKPCIGRKFEPAGGPNTEVGTEHGSWDIVASDRQVWMVSRFAKHEVEEGLAREYLTLPNTSQRLSHGGPAFFIRSKKCFVMFLNDHQNDGRIAIWCAAPEGFKPRWARPIRSASSGRPMSVTLVGSVFSCRKWTIRTQRDLAGGVRGATECSKDLARAVARALQGSALYGVWQRQGSLRRVP